MMDNEAGGPWYHDDFQRFRDSLTFTEAQTGFSARLIEKDYFCTLVLADLSRRFERALVFKGGTCLSKVHAEFFRLSEDLDFCVATPPEATRSDRRQAATTIKERFTEVPRRLTWFEVADPFTGYNNSRQYNGRLAYPSAVTGEREFINVEVSFREEIILPSELLPARTLLRDPQSAQAPLPPVDVYVLQRPEAYAEKIRAALTRPEPAIRDFFDIDHALQSALLDHRDPKMRALVAKKLSVAADDPVDLSESKLANLQAQLATQLRPVLRAADYKAFDLERAFAALQEMMASSQS
jgi:predicted nucleotidyltransferase component of viral defense system